MFYFGVYASFYSPVDGTGEYDSNAALCQLV